MQIYAAGVNTENETLVTHCLINNFERKKISKEGSPEFNQDAITFLFDELNINKIPGKQSIYL